MARLTKEERAETEPKPAKDAKDGGEGGEVKRFTSGRRTG
jgi:hypothetical protein